MQSFHQSDRQLEMTNDLAPAVEAVTVSQPVFREAIKSLLLLLAPLAPPYS